MRRMLLAASLMGAACLPGGTSDSTEETAARLESHCDGQQNPEVPGGFALAAVKEGTVIFSKAYGMANNEYSVPLTAQSVFDFASIAKTFTGWSVAKLITEGRMSPDDDIRRYVPELPMFGRRITIAHLLHHTSGLPDWYALIPTTGRNYADVITNDMLLELIFSQNELNFVPGERFEYSNSGYLILAEAVTKVTGMDFADWCRREIFEPLGMRNTRFLKTHDEIIMNRAVSYCKEGDAGFANCYSQLASYGSSSLYSTLEDMTLWLLQIGRRDFGGREVWDLMLEEGRLNSGESVSYGYGISMRSHNSHASIGHGGKWRGYLSDMVYYPEEATGYVLLITQNPPTVWMTGKVDDILLGNTGGE
jgi:CubicO group peptidase (beta-lactamase class C family)